MASNVGNAEKTSAAFSELIDLRDALRRTILERISGMEPSAPDTLRYAVFAMLEAHYKIKDLSELFGPSQTTVGRWALGQTIPRNAHYREFLVERAISHLQSDSVAERPFAPAKNGMERLPEPLGGRKKTSPPQ